MIAPLIDELATEYGGKIKAVRERRGLHCSARAVLALNPRGREREPPRGGLLCASWAAHACRVPGARGAAAGRCARAAPLLQRSA